MLALPLSVLHHSKLTSAQLLDEGETTGVNLPHTWNKQENEEALLYCCIHIRGEVFNLLGEGIHVFLLSYQELNVTDTTYTMCI